MPIKLAIDPYLVSSLVLKAVSKVLDGRAGFLGSQSWRYWGIVRLLTNTS
jgi:hypothetical protein